MKRHSGPILYVVSKTGTPYLYHYPNMDVALAAWRDWNDTLWNERIGGYKGRFIYDPEIKTVMVHSLDQRALAMKVLQAEGRTIDQIITITEP